MTHSEAVRRFKRTAGNSHGFCGHPGRFANCKLDECVKDREALAAFDALPPEPPCASSIRVGPPHPDLDAKLAALNMRPTQEREPLWTVRGWICKSAQKNGCDALGDDSEAYCYLCGGEMVPCYVGTPPAQTVDPVAVAISELRTLESHFSYCAENATNGIAKGVYQSCARLTSDAMQRAADALEAALKGGGR